MTNSCLMDSNPIIHFKKIYFYFLCISALLKQMYVHHVCARYLQYFFRSQTVSDPLELWI